MDQIKLTSGKLLNVYGNLNQAGYATSLVKEYSRQDIKARKLRIKEWDYYYIGNQDYGIALTIDDNSYMGLGSVSVLDFKNDFWNTAQGTVAKRDTPWGVVTADTPKKNFVFSLHIPKIFCNFVV